MTEYIFTSDAKGTLEGAIGATDVTLTLETGGGSTFPSPSAGQGFTIFISDGTNTEEAVCTTRSTDSLTVTRGSPAYAFADGSDIEHRLHEDSLNQFLQKGQERDVVADPNGTAAVYTGEEVKDTVTGIWWKHTVGTTWQAMNSA